MDSVVQQLLDSTISVKKVEQYVAQHNVKSLSLHSPHLNEKELKEMGISAETFIRVKNYYEKQNPVLVELLAPHVYADSILLVNDQNKDLHFSYTVARIESGLQILRKASDVGKLIRYQANLHRGQKYTQKTVNDALAIRAGVTRDLIINDDMPRGSVVPSILYPSESCHVFILVHKLNDYHVYIAPTAYADTTETMTPTEIAVDLDKQDKFLQWRGSECYVILLGPVIEYHLLFL